MPATREHGGRIDPLLAVEGLSISLRTGRGIVYAVDDVSFRVNEGETVAIVGESGSGKTVTARSMVGLISKRVIEREAGLVRFLGENLLSASARRMSQIRGKSIGVVFQDPMSSLNPVVKVGDQVAEPLRRHLGMSKSAAVKRAAELLEEVQIPNARRRIDSYPHELSGGMRQRALIAAATSCRPKLLIADEPTTALDVTIEAEILGLLSALQKEHGMAMIIVSHDLNVVSRIADSVVVMYAGQVVEYAPSVELFANPEHPYTEGLIACIPPINRDHAYARRQRLQGITGSPPDLATPPVVCRFAERCAYASSRESCLYLMPRLREIRPNHWVRSSHPASERLGSQ